MILQTAQGVAASKDVLAELFERIGWFFARLETYTEVAPTTAMTNIITEIVAEVVRIFGIATKELKRGSASHREKPKLLIDDNFVKLSLN